MKNVLLSSIVFVLAFLLFSSFSLRESPQDPPRGDKKKHVKIIKVKNGEKVELDTFIKGNEVVVFDGDTIADVSSTIKLVGDMDFDFDVDFSDDCKGHKVIVLKSGNVPHHMINEFKVDGDSVKTIMIKMEGDIDVLDEDILWMGDGKHKAIKVPCLPAAPLPPVPKDIWSVHKKHSGNVIDLSDPGIISYKKKKLSNGREKIEIIRNEVTEDKEVEVKVDVLVDEEEVIPKIEKIKIIEEKKK